MTKRIWTYILSGIMIAVSCVGLLLFLFVPRTETDPITPLNFCVEDVEVEIGETVPNYYSISLTECDISFEVDKEGVIEIDKDKIVGISSGEVNVKMKAVYKQNIVEEEFKVTVLAERCSYEFHSFSGGRMEGDNIYLTSSICQFKISVYGRDGKEIEKPEISVELLEGDADVYYELRRVGISATTNARVKLKILDLDIELTLNIIVE